MYVSFTGIIRIRSRGDNNIITCCARARGAYLHVSPDDEPFALGIAELKELVSDGLHGAGILGSRGRRGRRCRHSCFFRFKSKLAGTLAAGICAVVARTKLRRRRTTGAKVARAHASS